MTSATFSSSCVREAGPSALVVQPFDAACGEASSPGTDRGAAEPETCGHVGTGLAIIEPEDDLDVRDDRMRQRARDSSWARVLSSRSILTAQGMSRSCVSRRKTTRS